MTIDNDYLLEWFKKLMLWSLAISVLKSVYIQRVSKEDKIQHGQEIIEGMVGEAYAEFETIMKPKGDKGGR